MDSMPMTSKCITVHLQIVKTSSCITTLLNLLELPKLTLDHMKANEQESILRTPTHLLPPLPPPLTHQRVNNVNSLPSRTHLQTYLVMISIHSQHTKLKKNIQFSSLFRFLHHSQCSHSSSCSCSSCWLSLSSLSGKWPESWHQQHS